MTSRYSWVGRSLLLFCLAMAVAVVYSNTLQAPFYFDDWKNIQANSHIQLNSFSVQGLLDAGFRSFSSNRPVANISFALNYLFGQFDTTGYHIVNIMVHIGAGIFLYLFLQTTFSLPLLRTTYEQKAGWVPFVTALVWLVHPLQIQSVTYIVQRMNSMAAMFYVLALLFYVRGRLAPAAITRTAMFVGCLVAGLLALGSKEIAVTLPVFIFFYEWYFFQDLRGEWLKRRPVYLGAMAAAILLAVYLLIGGHPVDVVMGGYLKRDFTMGQRMLTELRVVVFYLSLLLYPHPARLNLEHDFPLSTSLVAPASTLLSLLLLVVMAAGAVRLARKQRLYSFCLLWFLGNLILESSVIGLELIFEHRNYLPSMMLILMPVLWTSSLRPAVVRRTLLVTTVVVLAVWSYERNSVWSDEETFWRDCVSKSPQKFRVYLNYGEVLERKGRDGESLMSYAESLRLKPDFMPAYFNLANVLMNNGLFTQAEKYYTEVVHLDPHYHEARLNLAVTLEKLGRYDEAEKQYHLLLRDNPRDEMVYNNLGNIYLRQGRLGDAKKSYHEALRLKPGYADAYFNLGNAFMKEGRLLDAVNSYRQSLSAQPADPDVLYNLGIALERQQRFQEAMDNFAGALRLKPDFDLARYELAKIKRSLLTNGGDRLKR